MKEKQLLDELAEALRKRAAAKKIWADKRAAALEARGAYNEQVALVEEIQEEIETGVTGRPLLDEINDRAAANAAPFARAKDPPKRKQPEPKLAGLQYPSFKQTIDGFIKEDSSNAPAAPPTGQAAQSVNPAPPVASESSPAAPKANGKPLREPSITATKSAVPAPGIKRQFVMVPSGPDGWDSASLANAAEDLATNARDLILCGACGSARVNTAKLCPQCKCERWRYPYVDELTPTPPPPPTRVPAEPKRKGPPRARRHP